MPSCCVGDHDLAQSCMKNGNSYDVAMSHAQIDLLQLVGGDRMAGVQEKRGERKDGGKRESQIGGKREKLRKFCNILLYFTLEMGQRGGNHCGKGWEARVEDTGSRRFRCPTPLSLPTSQG